MISFTSLAYRREWIGNVRADLLSGLVVALALIPEAIAFSIIAGVDPKVGLYASFSIAVITAIVGGRPGMISAATAATAVLMVTLVRDHGLEYLLAATVLAGLLQIAAGLLRLGRFMRFVSRSVMTGFVNALAILIFMAQLPELDLGAPGVTWLTYALVAAGLAIIYLFPRVTKVIPSPLVTIVVLTLLVTLVGWEVRTVGDMGALPDTLPVFLIPQVPLNLGTLLTILPYSIAVAAVGLLESLMTQTIVDDLTDTTSDRNQECIGQGVANAATGFIGGMAGCAMIGQSMINVKSGGRGRLSTFAAGVFLLILIVGLGDLVAQIPMPALVAIMIMVSIGTFSWSSVKALRTHPRSSSIVMLATVAVVVYTHNLAIGVACRGAAVGHLLRRQDRPALPRDLGALGGRTRPDLSGQGTAVLRLGRGFHGGLRLSRGARHRRHRRERGAYLGYQLGAGARHDGAEVPPRGVRSSDHRHERGVRNHRRSAGDPRQARRDGQADWTLKGGGQ
jgi:SulP family sulfate permease